MKKPSGYREAQGEEATENNHGGAHGDYDIGTLAQAFGRHRKAIRLYKKEIARTSYFKAHYNLGVIFQGQKKWAAAIEEYRKALRRNPRLHQAWNNLGICYGRLEIHKKAIGAFSKAIKLSRKDPMYVTNLGIAHAYSGAYKRAIATLRKALTLAPTNIEALKQLGYLLIDQDLSLTEGMQLLRKAARISSNDPLIIASLGLGHLKMGRVGQAKRLAQKAKRLAPKDRFVLEQVRKIHRVS